MKPSSLAIALLLCAGPVLAHDGHGLSGAHWHATDTIGYLLAAAVGALLWFTRGK